MNDGLFQRIRDHATALDREAPPIPIDEIRGRGRSNDSQGFRRSFAVAAAIVLVVVGGVVAVDIVREPAPDPSAEPAPPVPTPSVPTPSVPVPPVPATSVPDSSVLDSPVPDSSVPAQLGACESAFDVYVATSGGVEGGPTGLAGSRDVIAVDVVGEPGLQHVLFVGEDWVFTCLVTPRIGGIVTDVVRDGGALEPSYPDVTAQPGQVVVVSQTTTAIDVGPATITVIGRAAPDVATIGLVMASGTTIPGSLSSGWFIIDGDVGEGVALENYQIAWTLENGDERSSPMSLVTAQRFSALCPLFVGPCGSEPEESEESAGAPPRRPIAIVGDALTIGARDAGDLASRLATGGFDLTMVAAQPSADVAWGIEQAALGDVLPETVIVQLGPTEGSGAAAFEADVERMVNALDERSVQTIVWIVPRTEDASETASILRSVEGIDVVADWSAIVEANPGLLSGDDGRPTVHGFTVAALFIADAAATSRDP